MKMVPWEKQEKAGGDGEPGRRNVLCHAAQTATEQGKEQAKTDTDILHMHQDACQLHLRKHAASLGQHYTLKKSISLSLLAWHPGQSWFLFEHLTSDKLMSNCTHHTKYLMSIHLLLFAQYSHCKLLKAIFCLIFVELKKMDFWICN